MKGDRERTEAFAHRAFDLAGEDDPLGRGAAAGFLALAHWGGGDLEAAHGFWAEAMACLQRAGHAVDAIGCNRPLAEIRIAQGRLHEAMRSYEQGLRMATDARRPSCAARVTCTWGWQSCAWSGTTSMLPPITFG